MNSNKIYFGGEEYKLEDWLLKKEKIDQIPLDKEVYHIAMTLNDAYIKWAGILMESIMRENPQLQFSVCFHLLTDAIYKKDREKLQRFATKWNVSIVLYFMNDTNFDKFTHFSRTQKNGKILYSIYYRLLLPYLVDHKIIKKVLCIDVDTVCNKNISQMLKEEFKEPLLVIHDIGEKAHAKRLNLKSGNYFCAGFMYMNIEKMIEDKAVERVIQYLYYCVTNNIDLPLADQDALNIVMEGNVKFTNSLYHYPLMMGNRDVGTNEIQKNVRNAYFVHFLGKDKPWDIHTQEFPLVKKWKEDKLHSDWKNVQLIGEWDRRAYRLAYRGAWISKDYLKWVIYKAKFSLFGLMKR